MPSVLVAGHPLRPRGNDPHRRVEGDGQATSAAAGKRLGMAVHARGNRASAVQRCGRAGGRTRRTLVGVMLVVAGAALVQGGGRTTVTGIAWSLLALACEAAFTLLAVPILNRLGPFGISTHTCWIAALQLVVLAAIVDRGNAFPALNSDVVFAIGYLAVVLTAVAFVLWYSAVRRLGAPVAGLFAGLIPVAAALTGLIFGLTTITPSVLGGAGVVGIGIAIGLAASSKADAELSPTDAP